MTIVLMFIWTVILFIRGQNSRRHAPQQNQPLTDEYTWVFMVPALNEEVTIADSVQRLLGVAVKNKRIVVIDDGSEDSTPRILASFSDPALIPLHRESPDAQTGKAAALNWAYRQLGELLPDVDPAQVIVAIVDADGRLHTDAPSWVVGHFADPKVGGVQSQVRIYNRKKLLAWFQDVEFGVYGALFQSGRNGWGTAGMGGNGQFNRLSALDDVADETGPWRDKLTEDQDLGLRLLGKGWLGRQDLRATVDQQGLSTLRPLLRQRTRWSQGNLQAMALLGTVLRSPRSAVARFETMLYILMPVWQSIIGISMLVAAYLLITGQAGIYDTDALYQIAFFYVLGFGGVIMGCIAAGAPRGWKGYVTGFFIAQVYAFYTWLIWPVLLRSTFRQLTDQRTWAKTDREALDAPGAD
ncbi:MAG: glycosyltransferase family 2 protein [Solirubrobacteraceae bacterium]|nr:glycosyltransferase family 2 protein [Solirubrobacteraceae bacterium]